MTHAEKIRKALSDEELLCQLAEEASELAQAALKMRRCIVGGNPTPVTEREVMRDLVEELADVKVVKTILFAERQPEIDDRIDGTAYLKIERWVRRLERR